MNILKTQVFPRFQHQRKSPALGSHHLKHVQNLPMEFFFLENSPNFKAHLYGACIPDGMIVSQLCALFYCNFCWRLIRSSSVILNGFEGIVKEQPTVDLHLLSFLCHRGCIYWRHMRALQRWLGLTSKMYPISWCHGFSRNLNRWGGLDLSWQAANDVFETSWY